MTRKNFDLSSNLSKELSVLPTQIYDVMIDIMYIDSQLRDLNQEITNREGNLSNDIAMNPERYGYPLGTTVERFKIKARLLSDKNLQELNKKKLELEKQLNERKVELECLKHKKEVLMCLMKNG